VREIRKGGPVVPFRVRSAPFVAQANVDGQFAVDSPVVLYVEARLLGFVGHRRFDAQLPAGAPSHSQAGERVALGDFAVAGLLVVDIRPECKQSRRIVRLPEAVEKGSLLSAELQNMRTLHPRESGRIRVKRMREMRVHTALIEEIAVDGI